MVVGVKWVVVVVKCVVLEGSGRKWVVGGVKWVVVGGTGRRMDSSRCQ